MFLQVVESNTLSTAIQVEVKSKDVSIYLKNFNSCLSFFIQEASDHIFKHQFSAFLCLNCFLTFLKFFFILKDHHFTCASQNRFVVFCYCSRALSDLLSWHLRRNFFKNVFFPKCLNVTVIHFFVPFFFSIVNQFLVFAVKLVCVQNNFVFLLLLGQSFTARPR